MSAVDLPSIDPFAYDVFLSHSSKDKDIVRPLAERLRDDGLHVWFDEWEIKPGDPIGLKIEQGLEQSRVLVFAMSRHALTSEWTMLERQTAMFRDPVNTQRRFVPLRLDNAKISDTLRQFKYIDWRQSTSDQYDELLEVCRSAHIKAKLKIGPSDAIPPIQSILERASAVAVSADGRRALFGSSDNTVRLWDLGIPKCLSILEGHDKRVFDLAMTPDGRTAVSGASDGSARVWDLCSAKCLAVLEGHAAAILAVAVTRDGTRVASASHDLTVRIWDPKLQQSCATCSGHTAAVFGVAIALDGRRVVSTSYDGTIRVWELETGTPLAVYSGIVDEFDSDVIRRVAVTADGLRGISGHRNGTLCVWDLSTGRRYGILEGHTMPVVQVAVTPNGERAISCDSGGTIRVWDTTSGRTVAVLDRNAGPLESLAVSPDGLRAISVSWQKGIFIWDLPPVPEATALSSSSLRYTDAKVVLVGNSGVGKSGLAFRLAENRFAPTLPTHAVSVTHLKLPHNRTSHDIEREVWLWDFGGQADCRILHQMFLHGTSVAVYVFDPQADRPFEGLPQWDAAFERASHGHFHKLLTGGRCDRGGLRASLRSIGRFRRELSLSAFVETSARTGKGCMELLNAIEQSIEWESIPWTASPLAFRALKDTIVDLRKEGNVLLRLSELRQQIEMRLPDQEFSFEEMLTTIRLLASRGIIWQLDFGDFVLLQPEQINAYASAVIRTVNMHSGEQGRIAEERVLNADLDYENMTRLARTEEQIVLRVMHRFLLQQGICIRDFTDAGVMLVFPSCCKLDPPRLPIPLVTYRCRAPADYLYASLVVRLVHTLGFEKQQLWRHTAEFTTNGRRLGLKMTQSAEDVAEISLYFESNVPLDAKATFIRCVHDHVKAKDPKTARIRHYLCPRCNTTLDDRRPIQSRLSSNQPVAVCGSCKTAVPLVNELEDALVSAKTRRHARELEYQARHRALRESLELRLLAHIIAVAAEAGQACRWYTTSDNGIDGEIELSDYNGNLTKSRVYLHARAGDAHLRKRKKDGVELFRIEDMGMAEGWLHRHYPVMLVVCTSDGRVRWMDVKATLLRLRKTGLRDTRCVEFHSEDFSAMALLRVRDMVIREVEQTSVIENGKNTARAGRS